MEVADADVGRGVVRVLPFAGEGGIGFIEDNAGKGFWICDDELYVVWNIDLTGRMRIGHGIGMRLNGKAGASSH